MILDGRERTVRANRVLENERIIKEKLGRPIHVDPPAAACRPPMTEISLISLLSAIETADENPLQFFSQAIPSAVGR